MAKNENSIRLGKNIKKFRKQNGLTLEELGKMIDVTKQTVQRYETGEIGSIPYDKLVAMSKAFGIKGEELLGWEETKEEKYSSENAKLVGKIRRDKEMTELLIKFYEKDEDTKNKVIEMLKILLK